MKFKRSFTILCILLTSLLVASPVLAVNTNSMELNGSNQWVSITNGDQTGLSFITDFSVVYWINFDSLPTAGNFNTIFSKQVGAGGWKIEMDNNGGDIRWTLGIDDGPTKNNAVVNNWQPTTTVWYHHAWTYNITTGNVDFFVALQGGSHTEIVLDDNTAGTGVVDGGADFFVGGSSGGGNVNGKFDDIKAYSDIRILSELNDNFEIELSSTSSINLVGYWKFNGSPTLNLVDDANNADSKNDLTNNNTAIPSADIPFPIVVAAVIPKKEGIKWF